MRTILHIGMYKTGTTAVQRVFTQCRADLIKQGVFYPENDRGLYAHYALMPLTRPYRPLWGLDSAPEREKDIANARAVFERIKAGVATNKPHTLVLSNEAWFSPIDDGAQELIERLSEISDMIEVVAWVREPTSLISATCRQEAQSSRYVTSIYSQLFQPHLEGWMKQVGKDNMIVRRYAREALVGGDIVDDFNHVLFDGKLVLSASDRNAENPSFSVEAAMLFQTYCSAAQPGNHWTITQREGTFRNTLWKIDAQTPTPPTVRMKPEILDYLQRVESGVGWLRDTFGIEFPEVDYAAPRSEALAPPQVKTLTDVFEVNRDRLDELCTLLREQFPKEWSEIEHSQSLGGKIRMRLFDWRQWIRAR